MKEHFGFNDEEYSALTSNGVTAEHMFTFIKEYGIGKLGVLYCIDALGDFNKGRQVAHKKIAKALFEKQDNETKWMILEYINDE